MFVCFYLSFLSFIIFFFLLIFRNNCLVYLVLACSHLSFLVVFFCHFFCYYLSFLSFVFFSPFFVITVLLIFRVLTSSHLSFLGLYSYLFFTSQLTSFSSLILHVDNHTFMLSYLLISTSNLTLTQQRKTHGQVANCTCMLMRGRKHLGLTWILTESQN